jgi:hypothetical protein
VVGFTKNGMNIRIRDKSLKTGENYYITVSSISEKAELSIVVTQKHTIV